MLVMYFVMLVVLSNKVNESNKVKEFLNNFLLFATGLCTIGWQVIFSAFLHCIRKNESCNDWHEIKTKVFVANSSEITYVSVQCMNTNFSTNVI